MQGLRASLLALGLGVVACAAPMASAVAIVPTFSMSFAEAGGPAWQNPSGDLGTGPLYALHYETDNSQFSFKWDVNADADPTVSSTLAVTNNTVNPQTFTSTVLLPIAPAITPTSVMRGSVGGTVSDANDDGTASLSIVSGSSLYAAFIDGVSVQTLHGSLLPVTVSLASTSANVPAASFGPAVPGPAALSTIAVQFQFTLSPHDSAVVSGVFTVTPEPTGLSLIGLIATAALGRRARRSRIGA